VHAEESFGERGSSLVSLRERAIAEYHELLAASGSVSKTVLERLHQGMHARRLVYGDRPIGVALRPHFLEHRQFSVMAKTAELVASALEKVERMVLRSRGLMTHLGLTEREQRLALVDPGFTPAAVTSRLDAFGHGPQMKFVEYNAENPSSLSDQEELNRLLFEVPAMSAFTQRYRLGQFSPVDKLLETVLATYRAWGGKDAPHVAILDWKNLPTENEFVLLRNHFAAHGVSTIICSPDELEYYGDKLRCGDFRIDVVYKRILIHEFLARYDDTHPLLQAFMNHDVCMINPFRCKILHKKESFELLTDESYQGCFTAAEREAIARSVPWTRRVCDCLTTWRGARTGLLELVRKSRKRLVLKPNDDYGGHGVYFGPELNERAWEEAVGNAVAGDYVVQEAVDLQREEFPIFTATEWKLQTMFVDTNPFLFAGKVCGAMVRLSSSPIVNVTSGGGETGFFVIKDVT